MDGYVPKPFDRELLAAEIRRVRELRGSAAESRPPVLPAPSRALLTPRVIDQLRGMHRRAPDVAAQVVLLFRTEGSRILTELRAAAVSADVQAISRLDHELLGSAAMLGAAGVEARAREIKERAGAGDFQAVLALLPDLTRTLAETSSAFEQALAS